MEARVVEAWVAADHASAFLAADHDAIDATGPLRSLVVSSLLEAGEAGRDLFHALGGLGRAIAERGGSPTLAAGTVDRLLEVLRAHHLDAGSETSSAAARGAVVESYVHVLSGMHADAARRGWDYPACVVPLGDATVAIAAGYPTDDAEALAGWAARVAHAIARKGVRRAVVAGSEAAVLALTETLELAGIERKLQSPR